MKLKKYAYLSMILAFLLPALVTATVIIGYTYPISVNGTTPNIYLEEGPNYAVADSMGLFNVTSFVKTPTPIASGTTIYINTTTGAGTVYLLNVLEIVNDTGVSAPTYIWLNFTTAVSGLTLYYRTSLLTFDGSTVSGTAVTSTSGAIPLSSPTLYIGFSLTGAASGTGTLTIQYKIG